MVTNRDQVFPKIIFPSLITFHNTYASITPDYIHSCYLSKHRRKSHNSPSKKSSIPHRNSRIRQIGYSTNWSTFITLTFNNKYYWSDYNLFQHQFRLFIKKLEKRTQAPHTPLITANSHNYRELFLNRDQNGLPVKPRSYLRYLAVLEHGKKSGRIHYHILTNISFSSGSCFRKLKSDKHKICPLWTCGFSDVAEVTNENCNAVHYLLKYLTKKQQRRTPIGKREVFSSRGLNEVKKIVTYEPSKYLTDYDFGATFNQSIIYYKKTKKIGVSHFSKKNEKKDPNPKTLCGE